MVEIQQRRWHRYGDAADLYRHATAAVARIASESIAARGAFRIVLAGGGTPNALYRLLAGLNADWRHWHVYWGDERCVAPGHGDRNSLQARQAWLDQAAIPLAQVHPIPAELGCAEGAKRYAELLAGVPAFDLVLLGLGEDGHTASLFPGQDWGEATAAPAALAVQGAPKPPPERVSLSAARLSHAGHVFFLVAGAGKQEALQRWQGGDAIPAASIRPAGGVDILLAE